LHRHARSNLGPQKIAEGNVALAGSGADLEAWARALRALPGGSVAEGDVLAWVEGPLRRFFPFDKFWLAYGNLSGGRIRMLSLLSSGHSPDFLLSRQPEFDLKTRGCFSWWVANRKPFILDKRGALVEAGLSVLATKLEIEEVERFSFGNLAAHGVIDPFVNAGTYISFAGVPRTQPKRILASLELIAPVLHTLYLATKQTATSTVDSTALTDRQRELVYLAASGLSDKAIAQRLAISDHTVGNHFRAIYARLGISKRSQLIALLK
jgi:DNA-binding CsgD family transcriptional regulator